MKFRKIIQFIQSAWRELRLRFLCITQQQAEEGYQRLRTTVEELQETIVLLQKRIEELESQLNKTNKRLADYQANAAANEKLEALGKKFTTELEKFDARRIDDNKRIEDGLGELKKMMKKWGKPPVERGGEWDPIPPTENNNRATKPQPPQCRFVCYEDNGRWVVALAVESGQDVQSVKQGDNDLSANGGRYILENLDAEVTVEFQGEHSSKVLNLFDEHNDEHKFAVFKMRKDWQGEGQKVKTLSSGHYVVFAHKSCDERIGTPPVEAAQCRYDNFTVHLHFLPPPPQCRFVCYEDNGRWVVALAVESGQDVQSVKQGDNDLSANGGRYILEDIGAKVTVEFKVEHSKVEHSSKVLNLFDEHNDEHKFAVFKMRKNWQGEGQKVKTLSSGDYVVFAHKSCGKRSGKAPIEAEQCRYPDFTVHFFSIPKDTAKMNDGFENCSLPFSSTKRFLLKGKSIADDSDLGELFGDDAPQLDDAEEWRAISWIVVGRENRGKVLAKFRPKEKTLAEVLGERRGWFFVRIYDAKVDLLHSFDFRRAKGLKNIFVNNQPLGEVAPIVPSKNGHTETSVQFDIEGNLTVRPADDSNGICKVMEKENAFAVSPQDKDRLPRPDNDKTKWVLGSGEECVEAEILLPRIWWKFIKEKGKEADWQATPIEMDRKAFRGAKNEKIRIRLPLCIPEIVVGFGDFHSPDNPTIRTQLSKDRKTCEAEFRLEDFAFDQAIEKPLRKAMDLCVKLKDSDVVFPIVRIPADAPPDDVPPPIIEPEIGKGFSRLELERAKEELYQEGLITAAKAAEKFDAKGLKEAFLFDNIQKCLTIPFDPQRKSMHPKNVEKLKAFFKKHFEGNNHA